MWWDRAVWILSRSERAESEDWESSFSREGEGSEGMHSSVAGPSGSVGGVEVEDVDVDRRLDVVRLYAAGIWKSGRSSGYCNTRLLVMYLRSWPKGASLIIADISVEFRDQLDE